MMTISTSPVIAMPEKRLINDDSALADFIILPIEKDDEIEANAPRKTDKQIISLDRPRAN